MRRLPLLVLLALGAAGLAPSPGAAEAATPTAADVTERGRSLDTILDLVLVPPSPPPPEGRAVLFLLDVTPSLVRAEFPARLAKAMERNAEALAKTRIGIAVAGDEVRPLLLPTDQYAVVRQTVTEVCQAPVTRFQNLYAELRRIAPTLAREAGLREVVVVSLENGDVEDDVEAAVTALERAEVRCFAVAREAFLSDPYWAATRQVGPKGTTFMGPEAAFIEIPWGLRHEGIPATATVPSGFAYYGLNRLAAATRGRVYLFYPVEDGTHVCIDPWIGVCPFCDADHVPPDEAYQTHRLRELAPLAVARKDALALAAADPYYRAVLDAWEKLAEEDLVYSVPSLKRSSQGVRLESRPFRGWTQLGWTVAFASEAAHARRLQAALEGVLRELEAAIQRADEKGGMPRYRAVAETTRLLVHAARLNLIVFEAFCTDVGPRLAEAGPTDFEPPERWPWPDGTRWRYVSYGLLSLCHGPASFRDVRLPGGERVRQAFGEYEAAWDDFARRYAHTPFLLAVRRSGIARFHLVPDVDWRWPGRKPDSSETEEAVTLPERPARPGRASGGGGGGGGAPTSGG